MRKALLRTLVLFAAVAPLAARADGSRKAPGSISGSIAAPLPPHAVVWLEGPGLPRPHAPTKPAPTKKAPPAATIASRGVRLEPYFTVILAGQEIAFPQADALVHNLFSGSRAKRFELGSYQRGQSRTLRFDTPGVVEIFCHYHEETHATLVVVPSPLYARPDEAGRFAIAGVPPGRYLLRAFSPEGGPIFQRVEIAPGQSLAVGPLRFPRNDPPDEQKPEKESPAGSLPPQFGR